MPEQPLDFDVLNRRKPDPLAGPPPRERRERRTGAVSIAAGVWLGLLLWAATVWLFTQVTSGGLR